MRIVKEFNERGWKITIFQYNGKYSLQVEDGLLQQRYKLPTILNGADLDQLSPKISDISVQQKIQDVFVAMRKSLPLFSPQLDDSEQDEFDDIV